MEEFEEKYLKSFFYLCVSVKMKLNYLSFFSGIGGFELALENTFGEKATCVGFSEIDKTAISVYKHHYPQHHELGDITKITTKQLTQLHNQHKHIDLIVGGFPCQNMSTANTKGTRDGIQGEKSGLFFDLLRIIKVITRLNKDSNRRTYFILENVRGSNAFRDEITDHLTNSFGNIVSETELNSMHFSAQKRLRYVWTNFPVHPINKDIKGPTLKTILAPVAQVIKHADDLQCSDKMVQYLNAMIPMKKEASASSHFRASLESKDQKTGLKYYSFKPTRPRDKNAIVRWTMYGFSDTEKLKSRTIPSHYLSVLVDRRISPKGFIIRSFFPEELERLFTYPAGWTKFNEEDKKIGKTKRAQLLGNSVVVKAIQYVTDSLQNAFRN